MEINNYEYITTKSYGTIEKKQYYTAKKLLLEIQFLNQLLTSANIPYTVKAEISEDVKNRKENELCFFMDNLNRKTKASNSEELEVYRKCFKNNLDDIDNHSSFKIG
jgi:hypothetical protein